MKLFTQEKQLFVGRKGGWPVEVFEKGDRRELRFGNNIVQSAFDPMAPDVIVLEYARAMLAGMLCVPKPETVLHLGLGAGTIPRFLHRHWPTVRQRVVEINPDVVEAAYRYFDLPVSRRLHVTEADAWAYLADSNDAYDLMFVDVFVAENAATGYDKIESLAAQRKRLKPTGWLIQNAWGSDRDGLGRLSSRLAALYPCMYAVSVRAHSNVILICGASSESLGPSLLKSRADQLGASIPFDFARWPSRMQPLGRAQRSGTEAWIARA